MEAPAICKRMPNKTNDSQRNKNRLKNYAKYSGMAFQMMGIILMGTFAGFQADKWLELKFPVFTVSGVIISVIVAMYFAVKDLLKK